MIFYNQPLKVFLDSDPVQIREHLSHTLKDYFNEERSEEEKRSWEKTVELFQSLFSGGALPDDTGIALEYNIPYTELRVDCILTGKDKSGQAHAVLVEMKGWRNVERTPRYGLVRTALLGARRDVEHPSMQAAWYAETLSATQTAVWQGDVVLHPCAFLYNCESRDVIYDSAYSDFTSAARAFCKGEEGNFISFIRQFIETGDRGCALQAIDSSRREISNRLADAITEMSDNNELFPLSPEQKSLVERIVNAAEYQEKQNEKVVLIIEGGPGTGKSVIAIRALCELALRSKKNNSGQVIRYITKTRPPKSLIKNTMHDATTPRSADALELVSYLGYPNQGGMINGVHVSLVDEAHRLDSSRGDQVELIIDKSDVAVFFTDQRQIVSVADIGTLEHIRSVAIKNNATYNRDPLRLSINFRVSITGSIEHLLQYPGSRNLPLPPQTEYDFRVFDDPMEMYRALREHDENGRKARMVAGYTRRWVSRNGGNTPDWTLEECPGFRFLWNMNESNEEANWATRQGLDRIGCIHSCQGMEFDYIGVLISKDISVDENGRLEFHPENHAADDPALREHCIPTSSMSPEKAHHISELIRNTYFVLLTRGMKGCYVYIEGRADDPGTARMRAYFKQFEANRRK